MLIDNKEELQDCVDSESVEEKTECESTCEVEGPVDLWIKKNPQIRKDEVAFLRSANLGYGLKISPIEDLQQPFNVGDWTYLLVFDKAFPKKTEEGEFPIKVYFVCPGIEEFKKFYGVNLKKLSSVRIDKSGVPFLYFEEAAQELELYFNGQHNKLMAETMIQHTRVWTLAAQQYIDQQRKPRHKRRSEQKHFGWQSFSATVFAEQGSFIQHPKYVDGRSTHSCDPNPRCKKIVISDRAFVQIFNESQSKIETETGGFLLGHYENGVWYVVEASDPGINAVFREAYHEGDDVYQNHLCGVISRAYKHPLIFLGMWHRHPGSFDRFSGTDDGTNFKYANSVGNGCISAIINYDPDFRITFYYAELDAHHQIRYTKVDVEVGDDKITNKEIMALCDLSDIKSCM